MSNYLDNISIATNRHTTYFGFLNSHRKNFIAYSQSQTETRHVKILDTHKYTIPNIRARHTRNPQTKDNIFLHLEIGKELWIYVFFDNNEEVDTRQLEADLQRHMLGKTTEKKISIQKHAIRMGDKLPDAWSDAVFYKKINVEPSQRHTMAAGMADKDQKLNIIHGLTLSKKKEVQLRTATQMMNTRSS